MRPENQRHLPTLRLAEEALQTNVQVAGIDETARSHMELALAHVREATGVLRGEGGRTVRQLVNDQRSFDCRLQATLHISSEQFPKARLESDGDGPLPASLNETAMRRQFDNLDKVDNALRIVLHSHDIEEDSRAHLERARSHASESYIASIQPGTARSVTKLVSDLEKVERLITKLREQHIPGQITQTLRSCSHV
jgi:hypothetical protein